MVISSGFNTMLCIQPVSILIVLVDGYVFTFDFGFWDVRSICMEAMQGFSTCLFAPGAACGNFTASIRNLRHECALDQARVFLIFKVASIELHSSKFESFIFFVEVAICFCLFSSVMTQDWRNCDEEIANILSRNEFWPKLRNQVVRVRLIILVY